ncbi:thrombospondin type 3 repeat-containing protein [Gilvimarinus agarilyticus]|uniref:thrombospondin type 3 repeat-containing protein n=1 Tax=Gilvimarinus agarilyticus TaxID=679259 RepID=UPI00059F34DB|nr:thrombospondin type 3 repeat-containing protein [Gilvimarinus agarilyticus]
MVNSNTNRVRSILSTALIGLSAAAHADTINVEAEAFVIQMEAFDETGSGDSRAKGVVIGERGYPSDKHTVVDSVQTTDWVDYNIDFPVSDNYRIDMLASGQISHATAILFVDGVEINEVSVATGNQAEFEDFTLIPSVYISAGSHTIRVQSGSSTDTYSWTWFGDALTFTPLSADTGETDSDSDGVTDNFDQCPNTAPGSAVDSNGCEVVAVGDQDDDGVLDDVDQCPNTAPGATVDSDGCEVVVVGDQDNDGVLDDVDQCPNTPTGAAVDSNGCEVVINDQDNDGVSDDIDQCPNTPSNEAANAQGCSSSQTGDGDGSGGDTQPGANEGLLYGEVQGATNWSDANPSWIRTTDLNQTEDSIGGDTTEIYTGMIYDADGQISFYEHIDDSVRLYIDGNLVLSNDSWEDSSETGNLNLAPGSHEFELRIGNADGGSGPVDGLGFGIDVNGGTNFVHPSTLTENIFTSDGELSGDPDAPKEGDVILELEDFVATGTVGRVGGDPNDGFVAEGNATTISWVTNGDWGDYNVQFDEPGTYKAYITTATPASGSFGARIDLEGEPAAWGYFESTGGWDVSEEILLYGGHFSIDQAGSKNIRVEAIGGSDWQWGGDKIRFTRIGDYTPAPTRLYNPADHTVAEIQGPATGFQYLKEPVPIPTENKVLKSDVWYTYPQNRDFWVDDEQPYQDFGATGSFWGHPPEHDFYDDTVIMDWAIEVVDKYQGEGLEYTARGEFDWGFRWVTEYLTNPEPHYVKTLDDRNVRMTFMGYLSYNGYNNNWLSNHSPAFVPFMKSQVDQLLKANPDKLMFDTQTNSTRTTDMRTFGGDFSHYAMENFRAWLSKKYDSTQLAALGINDIDTFDYGEFLISKGVTHTTWSNAGNTITGNIPLLEDFIYFNRDVWNQKFGEVLEYIRETHPSIAIGASTQLFESRGYTFNENVTFLANELFLDVKLPLTELPTNIIAQLKAAEAVGKPLAYFPYPSEFKKLRDNDAPRYGRGWVALSYAYGGLFSIPANVWIGAADANTWSPGADNYRDIYQFVRNNETLFDGYESYSKVGLMHAMYSSMKANLLNGGNQVLSSTRTLTLDNINFDLLVFGDEGYQVIPRQADFDKFEYIFTDGDLNLLTADQRAILDAQGDKVRHIGQRGTIDGININVSINGSESNEMVSAVSRVHETDTSAPYVVHLINRPFANGVTPILNGVEVSIPQSFFAEAITGARLHLPDGTSETVTLSTNAAGDAVIAVNNLEVWGILELSH